MRKTVCYCDICKKEVKETDLQLFSVDRNYELCKSCIYGIVHRVIRDKVLILTPWCKVCDGVGKIKESVGPDYDHVQYETKKCENCKI